MLNQVILVGKIVEDPKEVVTSNDELVVVMSLGIERHYKNEDGNYDSDIIEVVINRYLAETSKEYLEKDMTVGVKARLTSKYDGITVVAEKLTFINAKGE